MGRRFDIVQIPKNMNRADFPQNVELSKPFMVNGHMYVCEETGVSGLKVVEEEKDLDPQSEEAKNDKKVRSTSNKHYYVIRKL